MELVCECFTRDKAGGVFDTNWDGHHDGWVVGPGGLIPLRENALSGCLKK